MGVIYVEYSILLFYIIAAMNISEESIAASQIFIVNIYDSLTCTALQW